MRAPLMIIVTVLLNAYLVFAQTPAESQNLWYFPGTWTVEIHMKAAALSGKVFLGTERNEWIPGQSPLLSRQEEASPPAVAEFP